MKQFMPGSGEISQYASYASSFTSRISLPRYLPQFSHTVCLRFIVPQFGHLVKVGSSNFQFARRLSRLALETFFFGTAMLPTPPHSRNTLFQDSDSNNLRNTSKRGSGARLGHAQGPSFKSLPQLAHRPKQSSLHKNLEGNEISSSSVST